MNTFIIAVKAQHLIASLKQARKHPLDGFDASAAADVICTADAMVAPSEHRGKRGEARAIDARSVLIDAIARSAFVPGGVRIFGRHFEATWQQPEDTKAPFIVGDAVRYSSKFLRSTGQYTGVAPFRRGRIVKLKRYSSDFYVASIDWGDGADAECYCSEEERQTCQDCFSTGFRYPTVNVGNLEHVKLTAKQREEGWRELAAIFG